MTKCVFRRIFSCFGATTEKIVAHNSPWLENLRMHKNDVKLKLDLIERGSEKRVCVWSIFFHQHSCLAAACNLGASKLVHLSTMHIL